MSSHVAVIIEDQLHIPAGLDSLERFRDWVHSDEFPENGRIDYLDGAIEVDMSPEDLYTHGIVKSAIAGALHQIVTVGEMGNLFIDRTRISATSAGLSVEPDIVVVLWSTLDAGRVREVPARNAKPGRFIELEGAPDLVVEIVSDGSVRKDLERLPPLYQRAGIPEIWTVDARGDQLSFQVTTMADGRHRLVDPTPAGWSRSSVLGVSVRLDRRPGHGGRWRYGLEYSTD